MSGKIWRIKSVNESKYGLFIKRIAFSTRVTYGEMDGEYKYQINETGDGYILNEMHYMTMNNEKYKYQVYAVDSIQPPRTFYTRSKCV